MKMEIDPDLVIPDTGKSLEEGAIQPGTDRRLYGIKGCWGGDQTA